MQAVFALPRPASLDDPFISNSAAVARKPLAIHTPAHASNNTFGYASLQDKARAASIFAAASSSAPVAIVAPTSAKTRFVSGSQASSYTPMPLPVTPSSSYSSSSSMQMSSYTNGTYEQRSVPSTPNTPALSRSGESSDVEMTSSSYITTPPMMTRALHPTGDHQQYSSANAAAGSSSSTMMSSGNTLLRRMSTSLSSEDATQLRTSSSKPPQMKKAATSSKSGLSSSRTPSAIQTAHLKFAVAPLTPPLTPPTLSSSIHTVLPPCSIAIPAPAEPATFATVSARKLASHTLHQLFASQYTIHEELGSGGFGFVVRAERDVDGLSVAVKFIERNKIPAHGWVKSRHWGEAEGLSPLVEGYRVVPLEAFVLRSVNHEGVVAFIDLFEDDTYFYLVMEHHGTPWQGPPKKPSAVTVPSPMTQLPISPLASPALENGPSSPKKLAPPRPAPMERRASCDLFECIEQHTHFDERTARYIFAQIVDVVASLGAMGVCHRDIKDENIVISAPDYRVKLIDFGSAVIFDPRQPAPFYARFHGTQSFASSEILRGQPYQPPQSEVWSLGVLLSILVTGECPFSDAEAAKAGRLSRPKVALGRSVDALLRGCLEVDTRRRFTIDDVRNHPWLRDVRAF